MERTNRINTFLDPEFHLSFGFLKKSLKISSRESKWNICIKINEGYEGRSMRRRKAIILGERNFLASMQHVMLAISVILFQVIFGVSSGCRLRGPCLSSPEGMSLTKAVQRAITFFTPNNLFSRTASGERQVTLGRQEVREMRQQLHSVA